MTKIAVILFNLGGPDHPAAIRPFLFNLFSDPAIIRLPQPLRFLVARLISGKREKIAQKIYGKIGGRSPILKNTQAQAKALQQKLAGQGNVQCFIAMRYWHPFAEETMTEVKRFAPDQIILLPLYPQFSTTTTASSLESWHCVARKAGLAAPEKFLCCYPEESGFIRALAQLTKTAYEKAQAYGKPRVLFSAHGLPEKIVRAGDPYAWQCMRTAKAVAGELGIDELDWILCYQSRVGPLKWIGPSTDEEIRRAGRDKVPIVVVPIAFVSEHSETLVEIDMEYRHRAEQCGVPFFTYTGAVGTAPEFIDGLAILVRKALENDSSCISAAGGRICPQDFAGCYQNKS
jgi:ferrochelatase